MKDAERLSDNQAAALDSLLALARKQFKTILSHTGSPVYGRVFQYKNDPVLATHLRNDTPFLGDAPSLPPPPTVAATEHAET